MKCYGSGFTMGAGSDPNCHSDLAFTIQWSTIQCDMMCSKLMVANLVHSMELSRKFNKKKKKSQKHNWRTCVDLQNHKLWSDMALAGAKVCHTFEFGWQDSILIINHCNLKKKQLRKTREVTVSKNNPKHWRKGQKIRLWAIQTNGNQMYDTELTGSKGHSMADR